MDAPKLEVLTGPLKSLTFSLPKGDITVGRDDSNLIKIPHGSVSRQHCAFRHDHDGTIYVRDLGSRNGTLVNRAILSQECPLKPGDEIHVGTTLFVFTADNPQSPTSVTVNGNSSRFLSLQTVEAGPITVQVVRLLDALLKASLALATAASFEEWEAILIDASFTLTAAERVGVAAPDSGISSNTSSIEGVTREERLIRRPLAADLGIIRRSIAESHTILEPIGQQAVIVAPVRAASNTGVLYLEGASFTEDELHAIAAISTLCGLAWERVATTTRLVAENRRLWSKIDHDLIGESPAIATMIEFIAKIAPVSSNVLLLGESGTGKDLVATAIHRNSPRANKPYMTVNCGALPESLIESELFGVERGAFTGATAMRKGLFESAVGGTIFLDEISELPLTLQPTLLRVLQNHELRRLGGTSTIRVDFRLVAASNRDLAKMVQKGQFRPDLFHRLSVVSHVIPPLRERREDIPVLAEHFLRRFALRSRPACQGFSKAALTALSGYNWPGNVRELENAVERAVVMGGSDKIDVEDLPDSIHEFAATASRTGRFHEQVAAAKVQLIQDALQRGRTFVGAARILGVHPNYLHRLVNNLGLRGGVSGEE